MCVCIYDYIKFDPFTRCATWPSMRNKILRLLMLVFIVECSGRVWFCCLISRARIVIAKAAFNNKMALFSDKFKLNLRKKLVKCHPCSIDIYVAENATPQKVDRKYLEKSEMWCWWKMKMISWTDRVRNEEVLGRIKEERNTSHTLQRMEVNWIGHILQRNCFLEHVIEVKWKREERRRRRSKQLLDDLKETR